jgi:hypothetical protein
VFFPSGLLEALCLQEGQGDHGHISACRCSPFHD